MKRLVIGVVFGLAAALSSLAMGQSPFPRLLPPSDSFRLTLSESSKSTIPLGPSCTGEAGIVLTCQAFKITLQNNSQKTVRLSGDCRETWVAIWRKEPQASEGWWPISQRTGCRSLEWSNIRLKPGETTVVETRLISPTREGEALLPGSYTLRATLTVFGCIDPQESSDCLSPLQLKPQPPSTAYAIDFQDPLALVSNQIEVESRPLPDLGKMSFGFDVDVLARSSKSPSGGQGCDSGNEARIDCWLFKYKIRNSSTRAVRYATSSCSDSAIFPEYRDATGRWISLPRRLWSCSMNISIETPVLPGQTVEGEFTLSTIAPAYDTTPLRSPGEHRIRFRFLPSACFASPDGRFCLTAVESLEPIVSSEITETTPPF